MKNIKDEVEKCLKIYENFHKQTTANDIFKIFYEIENRLKIILIKITEKER